MGEVRVLKLHSLVMPDIHFEEWPLLISESSSCLYVFLQDGSNVVVV